MMGVHGARVQDMSGEARVRPARQSAAAGIAQSDPAGEEPAAGLPVFIAPPVLSSRRTGIHGKRMAWPKGCPDRGQ
jgi:hypothetical protein